MSSVSEALEAQLQSITDRELSNRLREVYVAAAHCIDNLALINLIKLEPQEADEGSADLALWEQMAPAVRDTVIAVNGLCEVIDAQFPPLEDSTAEVAEGADERILREATVVFQAVTKRIRAEILEVGNLMRRPELLSSRWALLSELQRMRAYLRGKVGDAVFLSALAIGPVRRQDVVPGVKEDVRRSVTFRATAADVCRSAEAALAKPTDARKLASTLGINFEVFAAMPAWKHVRAEAKREMLEARAKLKAIETAEHATVGMVPHVVSPVLTRLKDIAFAQTKELLFAHDLEAWSEALMRIDQARLHFSLETGAGMYLLTAALEAADKLKGRDEKTDIAVRRIRKEANDGRSDDATASLIRAAALGAEYLPLRLSGCSFANTHK